MKRHQRLAIFVIALGLILSCAGTAKAAIFQEHTPAAESTPAQAGAEQQAPAGERTKHDAGHGPNGVPEGELREQSEEAAGEEGGEFKQSAMVKRLAHFMSIEPKTAYWIFICLNFAILAAFFWWLLVKKINIGSAMRERTTMIQKGMEDARKASAEANARLSNIETRLQRLDSDVATLRSTADADFAAEEQRIKLAAEEDARRVIRSAEQEIASAAKTAQRDLKAFAADLAVDLAAKKIDVDAQTDQNLVRSFVEQLDAPGGKDGK